MKFVSFKALFTFNTRDGDDDKDYKSDNNLKFGGEKSITVSLRQLVPTELSLTDTKMHYQPLSYQQHVEIDFKFQVKKAEIACVSVLRAS